MDWSDRVLRDLVYERVRGRVDLLSLVELERDLTGSVRGALGLEDSVESWAAAERASRGLVEQAWRRLEEEWREIREMEFPFCALCSEAYECPAPVE